MIGHVFRAYGFDAHGDPVDEDGNVIHLGGRTEPQYWFKDLGNGRSSYRQADADPSYAGVITGLIFGAASSVDVARSDVVSTEGLIGYPVRTGAPRKHQVFELQHRDVVVIDGVRWVISGPVVWGVRAHALTGNRPRYRWIKATANR